VWYAGWCVDGGELEKRKRRRDVELYGFVGNEERMRRKCFLIRRFKSYSIVTETMELTPYIFLADL
jgi:hypothetical protein